MQQDGARFLVPKPIYYETLTHWYHDKNGDFANTDTLTLMLQREGILWESMHSPHNKIQNYNDTKIHQNFLHLINTVYSIKIHRNHKNRREPRKCLWGNYRVFNAVCFSCLLLNLCSWPESSRNIIYDDFDSYGWTIKRLILFIVCGLFRHQNRTIQLQGIIFVNISNKVEIFFLMDFRTEEPYFFIHLFERKCQKII